MGAKQTSQLIPLCHNVPLDKVDVTLALEPSQQAVSVQATAKTQAYTGSTTCTMRLLIFMPPIQLPHVLSS